MLGKIRADCELWLIFKRSVKSYRGFSVLGKIFVKGMQIKLCRIFCGERSGQISEFLMIFKRNVKIRKGFSVLGKIGADC